MAKAIDIELDQVVAVIDNGFVELHEYLRMREEAEEYLQSHPHALRVLNCIRLRLPDINERWTRGLIPDQDSTIM